MNKSDLLKELRARTQAGMKDCHDALRESNDDLEKAIDIIKTKGQNIVSSRINKVAAEGLVTTAYVKDEKTAIMLEVNCQTDFVARSTDFKKFAEDVLSNMVGQFILSPTSFNVNDPHIVEMRDRITTQTKENCVIRRWWVEQALDDNTMVFSYVHNGSNLGVLLSLQASNLQITNSPEFKQLGFDLAMQVAAMNPLAIDADHLDNDMVTRQRGIFETQLKEMKKPQAQLEKIISGKFNKWHTEVCLLSQESVVASKTTVEKMINNVAVKLGGEIQVINFIRCQVGEGIEVTKEDYLAEVGKLMS